MSFLMTKHNWRVWKMARKMNNQEKKKRKN